MQGRASIRRIGNSITARSRVTTCRCRAIRSSSSARSSGIAGSTAVAVLMLGPAPARGVNRKLRGAGMVARETNGHMPKLILIVEDDPDVAESVAAVLEAEGYRTDIAANGCEALAHLQKNSQPDLILLDMMMPVMDGWKFREEQRKLPALASIPVVTVTADGDARGKAAAIQAAGHMAKPVEINRLLDEVERICGLPEA